MDVLKSYTGIGKMRWITLLWCICIFAGCTLKTQEVVRSTSGVYSLRTEISGDEVEPTKQRCVRLRIVDESTGKELTYQTGASNTMKWAVGWLNEVLVLYSSDIGTHAYDVKNGKIIERRANEEEEEIGRKAYEKKYGKRPKF
jgi:hypothetical protein